ncbi:MAG: preprotein translocase subunit SecE [Clostridia bacterium]|nr:preprotein translocase subunit SecE [Clostridia bacterium]
MGKTEKTEKTNTNKKQKHFWKDFKAELKKVIWPTRSQVVNNTIIVIAIVLLVTAIVFVLDLAFEALNTYGINKLKTTVQNSVVSEEGENPEAHQHLHQKKMQKMKVEKTTVKEHQPQRKIMLIHQMIRQM